MGEAKRRKIEHDTALENLQHIDLANVAAAVRKLFIASSDIQGADCYGHVAHGQQLLQRLGLATEIAVGYAIWRVGVGDHDTVAHHPAVNTVPLSYAEGKSLVYHSWLAIAGRILDLSTYSLRRKAALLDASDGLRTTVDWCPDYLFADKSQVASVAEVVNGHRAGLFHYQRVGELERMARATARPPDAAEADMIWLLYQQPDMVLIGPNNYRINAE